MKVDAVCKARAYREHDARPFGCSDQRREDLDPLTWVFVHRGPMREPYTLAFRNWCLTDMRGWVLGPRDADRAIPE